MAEHNINRADTVVTAQSLEDLAKVITTLAHQTGNPDITVTAQILHHLVKIGYIGKSSVVVAPLPPPEPPASFLP